MTGALFCTMVLTVPRLTFLPTIVREALGSRSLPREPEPDLVMGGEEQVAAYTKAGRVDGVMSAAYLFHSAHATATIGGSRVVVDLGCGPATQLVQIAELNPKTSFLGIDLSERMLEQADAYAHGRGVGNVRFEQGDITNLESIASGSVDGVISTMALHHLPSMHQLRACFGEIARVLKPDGALYLADFGRLKSLKSVIFFAYMNAAHQPHIFSLDYERSLRAAFLFDELKSMAIEQLPREAHAYATFISPLVTVVQTPPRTLSPDLRAKLKTMRMALPRRYRKDLDDLRLFFRLGGLPEDPFR